MPESRGKAQETAARRDGAGTARGWPVCISGVSVQAERSERPSVVVSKEFEGSAKGIRRGFEGNEGRERENKFPSKKGAFCLKWSLFWLTDTGSTVNAHRAPGRFEGRLRCLPSAERDFA